MYKVLISLVFLIVTLFSQGQVPTFQWAQSLGGSSNDQGLGIAVDPSGNIYTSGYFSGTSDFDPGAGVYNLTAAGGDIFISKLDPSGNFLWAKVIGGAANDWSYATATDALGNVYITGYFYGTVDFDPGIGVYNLTASPSEIYILKLDASGNFVWAKAMSGANGMGYSIFVDASGNVYTTGQFQGTVDFDPGAGTYTLTTSGGAEVFISKLNTSGNFIWAKALGAPGNSDMGYSITVDPIGNVYTTGHFTNSGDFDPGVGIVNLTSSGQEDVFVSKLDASGNFVWATSMGGTLSDEARGIAVDGSGNVYTSGHFYGTADFDPGVGIVNLTSSGQEDIFVSKLDASGNFVWAKQMGGTSADNSTSIALDASGNIYTTGNFYSSADFDPGAATYNLSSTGLMDIFVLKLDVSGNFIWAGAMGGVSYDRGYAITTDVAGNIYTTGDYEGIGDFDPGASTYNLTSIGYGDTFVHKMNQLSVGIKANFAENDLNIYPNPLSDLFYCQLRSETQIVITNVLGVELFKKTLQSGKQRIDLGDQASGIYFVRAGTSVQKIIKE